MKFTNTFVFKDEINQNNKCQCYVTISVSEEISNKSIVYKIEYKYKYDFDEDFSEIIKAPHPFHNYGKQTKNLSGGEIVIKNSMTSEMVRYMLMKNDELEQFTGNTTVQHYRTLIMINLVKFWD